MKNITLALTIGVLIPMVGISGCSTVVSQIQDNEFRTQIVVNQMTTRFVERAEDPYERATRFREIIEKVRNTVSEGEVATVNGLVTLARSRAIDELDWENMSLADRNGINLMFNLAESAINDLVEDDALSENDLVELNKLYIWADSAAERVENEYE